MNAAEAFLTHGLRRSLNTLPRSRSVCDKLLTARTVAGKLGVSTETVLRWTRSGELPGFRLPSGQLRYRQDDLDAWLAQRATSNHDVEG
jgi:excisionase family DNA binding protein